MFKDLPSGEIHCDLVADAKGLFICVEGINGEYRGELIAESLNEYYDNHKDKNENN